LSGARLWGVSAKKVFMPSSGDPWRRNSVIGGWLADSGSYEFRFIEAAKRLGRAAIDDRLLDHYFYPMCFLFRHAFELTLKSLTMQAESFLAKLAKLGETDVETDLVALQESLRTHEKAHSLMWLLNQLEPRLERIPGCEPIPEAVRSAVVELHNIDPSGERFRYSVDRRGKPSFPEQQHVDIERVCRELAEAHLMLSAGLGSWLSENASVADEMLSDYEAEMRAEYGWEQGY
jgi:hypothetical protein